MITDLIISLLLLCHVIADFYLQTDEMAKNKLSNNKEIAFNALLTHCFHHFIITTAVVSLLLGYKIIFFTVILSFTHCILDYFKICLQKKHDINSIKLFILDQIMHILMILLVLPYMKYTKITKFTSLHIYFTNLMIKLFPVLGDVDNYIWIKVIYIILLYLFIINGGTVISKLTTKKLDTGAERIQDVEFDVEGELSFNGKKFKDDKVQIKGRMILKKPVVDEIQNNTQQSNDEVAAANETASQTLTVEKRNIILVSFLEAFKTTPYNLIMKKKYTGGEIIGVIERLLICTFVIHGNYVAISSVLAAKSIARYKKIEQDADFSDKFLIGTLSSVLVAVLAGLIYNLLF